MDKTDHGVAASLPERTEFGGLAKAVVLHIMYSRAIKDLDSDEHIVSNEMIRSCIVCSLEYSTQYIHSVLGDVTLLPVDISGIHR